MLRVEPEQRHRLVDIIDNLAERIEEAQNNGWLGEVQGLQVSLDAAGAKLAALDAGAPSAPISLGLPLLRQGD